MLDLFQTEVFALALFNPTSTDIHRIDLPAELPGVEPGDWVEINAVYNADINRRISVAYTRLIGKDPTPFDYTTLKHAQVETVVTRWSAPEAITSELVGKMDPLVRNFISDEYDRLRQGRSEDEKKESDSNSQVGLEPVTASSPQSSST